jgi:hypothetical protein
MRVRMRVYLDEHDDYFVNLNRAQHKILNHKKINCIMLRQTVACYNQNSMNEKGEILNGENQKRRPYLSAENIVQSFVRSMTNISPSSPHAQC